jgi:hypothetical protein
MCASSKEPTLGCKFLSEIFPIDEEGIELHFPFSKEALEGIGGL